jgi:rhodanese-related sulfurtransferase
MLMGSRGLGQDIPGREPQIERISVQELKAKIARNEPVTIIDVRGSASAASDSRIKGAIVVRSRRLGYRLTFPPLKDIPRDSEVVIYCGCADDEASVRAAQTMLAAGFKRVRALKGGWDAWLKAGGQLESKPKG